MSDLLGPALTESGRVIKLSPDPNGWVLELINGIWSEPTKPVSFEDFWNARVLSVEELRSYMEETD